MGKDAGKVKLIYATEIKTAKELLEKSKSEKGPLKEKYDELEKEISNHKKKYAFLLIG